MSNETAPRVYKATAQKQHNESWEITVENMSGSVLVPREVAPSRFARKTLESAARAFIQTKTAEPFTIQLKVSERGTLNESGKLRDLRENSVAGIVWDGNPEHEPRSVAWCAGVFAGDVELASKARDACRENKTVWLGLHGRRPFLCDSETPLGAVAAMHAASAQMLIVKAPADTLSELETVFN